MSADLRKLIATANLDLTDNIASGPYYAKHAANFDLDRWLRDHAEAIADLIDAAEALVTEVVNAGSLEEERSLGPLRTALEKVKP